MALPALKFSINTARDVDPTRTIVLRGQFVAQVNKRFRDLKGAINKLIIEDNFLDPVKPTEYQPGITLIGLAAKYEYLRSDVKVDQFMDWLKDQEAQKILKITQRLGGLRRGQSQAWTDTYIQSSYQKGIAQARADLRKAGADIPSFQSIPGGVAGVFNQPFHADRVALIYTRCFNEMEGITEAMNGYLSRELALGMAQGQSPYQIARRINEKVDNIGIVRGRLIARTEIVQSHNEAALNEYERAEVEIGEPVLVEWVHVMDVGNPNARPIHIERNGKIYERSVARGMLGEPNCRCGLAPWVKSLQKEVPVKPVKKEIKEIIEKAESKIANNAFETAIAFNNKGNEILRKKGVKSSVKFTAEDMNKLNWADEVIFTHNHPSGISFSDADILFMKKTELKEMRVVGKKYLYRANFTKKVDLDTVKQAIKHSNEIVRIRISQLIDSGKMTIKEANDIHWHEIWTYLKKRKDWFSYKRIER
jgi:proteasome lid subunit RPN8/RPN11